MLTKEMQAKTYVAVEKKFSNFLKDLEDLISVPSFLQEENYPHCKPIHQVLDVAIEKMAKFGFKTYKDPDAYYGYAEIGSGDTLIGILGHLDVVPPGDLNNWKTDPFKVTYKDGRAYGRGVQDDKGAALTSIYAFKTLLECGFKPNYRLRFIFGTDEETLWRGIYKYMEKEEKPAFGFTPDSAFPLLYAEKGVLQCKLVAKNESGLTFKGGDAFNAVPSLMKAPKDVALMAVLDKLGYEYRMDGDNIDILGKGMHAMASELGINAINRYLQAMEMIGKHTKAGRFAVDNLVGQKYAEPIFGGIADEASGELKFNLGKIELTPEQEILSIDIRIPVTYSKDDVVAKLSAKAEEYGFKYEEFNWLKPLYIPIDTKLVKQLMAAYQEASGDMETMPRTSGGATYARAMDNCVAFGALLPHAEKTEHQPNENMLLEDYKTAMKIYIHAFANFNE